MIANLVSLFIASRLQRQPIYEALAVQDGIHLPKHEARHGDGQRQIFAVMRPVTAALSTGLTVKEAWQKAQSGKIQSWLVLDRDGVVGVINRLVLEKEAAQDGDRELGTLVSGLDFPHVHSDQNLDLALDRMGRNQLDILPVVNRADIHKLEGVVTVRDVLVSYGVSQPDQA